MNTAEEIFLPVEGYGGKYEVSNRGTVRSVDRYIPHSITGKPFLRRGIVRTVFIDRKGYSVVGLHGNQGSRSHKVHRLVAMAFVPNPENKPQVNHKDGNKQNNNDWNLEWVTLDENMRHAAEKGLMNPLTGSDHQNSKPVIDTVTGKRYISVKAAARSIGISAKKLSSWLVGAHHNPTNLMFLKAYEEAAAGYEGKEAEQ